ncbi:oxidoreductase [Gilbertella persicaria]|uniref:oxidoreductase n=1 Tax=Gilbertella persicaria TaxID=101096 RepID=UPI00221EA013|nr:oxidoreductase [Gilbertella persicaria]KAI8097956.1 oxidoreductase [Gilbertella persicaria]
MAKQRKMNQINWKTTAGQIVRLYQTDLKGKVAIVAGANSGTGLETARVLSLVGAKVIIACRSLEKSKGAIEHIRTTVPHADLVPMQLDLGDLTTIKKFADDFLSLDLPLHLLINNAGIMACPKSFTKNGFETQFGVNHLGHFYLTSLLTEKIKASAPARIVNVSSSGNYLLASREGIDFDNLNAEKYYAPLGNYAQSKLANILHAKELQCRFDAEDVDVTVTSLHPGVVRTNLGRTTGFVAVVDMLYRMKNYAAALIHLFHIKNVKMGASTNVYCAVFPDVVKGESYADNAVNRRFLNPLANDQELAKKLWTVSEAMLASKIKQFKSSIH